MCVCAHARVCACTCVCVCVCGMCLGVTWNLQESVLSSCHVGRRDQILVVRLGGRLLYELTHLVSQDHYFNELITKQRDTMTL